MCKMYLLCSSHYVKDNLAVLWKENRRVGQVVVGILGRSQIILVNGYCGKWFPFFLRSIYLFIYLSIYLFIFRQRRRGGEREGEKRQCVLASHLPILGTWPTTQACALTGNGMGNPLVHRLVLKAMSHTSQGNSLDFILIVIGGQSRAYFIPKLLRLLAQNSLRQ